MDAFVLTIIGRDRTGLVEALSQVVADHGGSWDRSHVSELAGWFAGVVAVRVPHSSADAFQAALPSLHDRGLDVQVRQVPDDVAEDDRTRVGVAIVGADRAGIVREISTCLTALDVGILELRTWTEPAAFASGELFRVVASVALPDRLTELDLAVALEDLADDLMVDLIDVAPLVGDQP